MEAKEIVERMKAIKALLPAAAEVSAFLGSYDTDLVAISVRPHGYLKETGAYRCTAPDFAAALDEAYRKAASGDWNAATIRKMAMDIIDITQARGMCPASALRERQFSQVEIDGLGEKACALAAEMAAGAPFAITALTSVEAAQP